MSVAVVIIAKNEERSIRRCIESFKPFVNEVVVVDTGSHDKTITIARELEVKIFNFPWENDFSRARNYALDQSSSNFNIIVDADEWLISGGSDILQISKQLNGLAGQVQIINSFTNKEKIEHTSEWITRYLPHHIRYIGAVHERPDHDLKVVRTPLVFGHDGYEKSQLLKKQSRNRVILEECLRSSPDNPYYTYQLGKEYENSEDYEEASILYERALKIVPKEQSYRHDLVVRSIFTFKMAKKFSNIFSLSSELEFPNSPDFFFVLGDALLDYALFNPSRAVEFLPLIENSWKTCLSIGENTDLPSTVIGRGSFLAAENLSIFYQITGDQEKEKYYRDLAQEFRRKIRLF